MKILLLSDPKRLVELQQKMEQTSHQLFFPENNEEETNLANYQVIIDTDFDEISVENALLRLEKYATLKDTIVLVGAVKRSLSHIAFLFQKDINCCLLGFNNLPTFINRSLWEVSILHQRHQALAEATLQDLELPHRWVKDKVGMISPRIIGMIINEAYYTLQEGTASIEDINLAMKLGTNYPFGPFEWCDRIGIQHIYQTLEAVYEDTKDERYKICYALKQAYYN